MHTVSPTSNSLASGVRATLGLWDCGSTNGVCVKVASKEVRDRSSRSSLAEAGFLIAALYRICERVPKVRAGLNNLEAGDDEL